MQELLLNHLGLNLLKRREFKTTKFEENAIAAEAIMGLSKICLNGYKTPAAIGIPIIL